MHVFPPSPSPQPSLQPRARTTNVSTECWLLCYLFCCRREVMDAYLRDRAEKDGAKVINGLMMRMEQPGRSRMTEPMTLFVILL